MWTGDRECFDANIAVPLEADLKVSATLEKRLEEGKSLN
jgi:hypothetical protein